MDVVLEDRSLAGLGVTRRVRCSADGVEVRVSWLVPLRKKRTPRSALEAVTLAQETRHVRDGTYEVFHVHAIGAGGGVRLASYRGDAARATEEARRAAAALGVPFRDRRPTAEELAAWKPPSSTVGIVIFVGVIALAIAGFVALAIWG